MEGEFLEHKWFSTQVCTESLLERFDFLHAFNELLARFTNDLLSHLVGFQDLVSDLVNGSLHSLGEQLSFVFIQVLGLDLPFF